MSLFLPPAIEPNSKTVGDIGFHSVQPDKTAAPIDAFLAHHNLRSGQNILCFERAAESNHERAARSSPQAATIMARGNGVVSTDRIGIMWRTVQSEKMNTLFCRIERNIHCCISALALDANTACSTWMSQYSVVTYILWNFLFFL